MQYYFTAKHRWWKNEGYVNNSMEFCKEARSETIAKRKQLTKGALTEFIGKYLHMQTKQTSQGENKVSMLMWDC